ncbi:putative nucleic acid-binding Zn ribbon protein [Streptomyces sp. B3I7]|uniref:NADase-type glycan-binding domain-containing protein n=1 Tax=Streptomyces sp. B3I7 TaxID=3042269 RepID=UPI0027856993|nr:zinc ribbon domain-containing protein [Streptomyces sp. B3I7]MDQ0812254.1 putative nucleic acid-binding Zn ribbon protein [Streptomyces sp. B3I7]
MTTQNCAECGTRAEPGQSFCDGCGAVLGWTGRGRSGADGSDRADGGGDGGGATARPARSARPSLPTRATPPAAPSPAAGAAVTDTRSGDPTWDAFSRADPADPLLTRRPDPADAAEPAEPAPPAGGADRVEPAGHAFAPTVPAPGRGPGAGTGFGSGPAEPPGAAEDIYDTIPTPSMPPAPGVAPGPLPGPGPDALADRARSLLVPVDEPGPRTAPQPGVAPVLPGVPVADRPEVRAPGQTPGAHGGPPCPWCATPNPPGRHYCVRCAMSLAGAGEERERESRSWWRRMTDRRNRETPWAGDRPRLRRAFDRVLSWLVAALVVTGLVLVCFQIPGGVQATRDHFAKRAPLSPDAVSASRSYPGHKPALAFDKLNNTWWGPGVVESGRGEWIEARFAQPTRLLDLLVTSGVSTRSDELTRSALPHLVEARITTADGRTTTRTIALDQAAGPQRRAFRVHDVTAVRFTVESSYAVSEKKQVALAEIEFFGPSNASGS